MRHMRRSRQVRCSLECTWAEVLTGMRGITSSTPGLAPRPHWYTKSSPVLRLKAVKLKATREAFVHTGGSWNLRTGGEVGNTVAAWACYAGTACALGCPAGRPDVFQWQFARRTPCLHVCSTCWSQLCLPLHALARHCWLAMHCWLSATQQRRLSPAPTRWEPRLQPVTSVPVQQAGTSTGQLQPAHRAARAARGRQHLQGALQLPLLRGHRIPLNLVQAHPQPSATSQLGAWRLQLPPRGFEDALLAFCSPVLVSRGTRCSRHVGSCPHSSALPCTAQARRQGRCWPRSLSLSLRSLSGPPCRRARVHSRACPGLLRHAPSLPRVHTWLSVLPLASHSAERRVEQHHSCYLDAHGWCGVERNPFQIQVCGRAPAGAQRRPGWCPRRTRPGAPRSLNCWSAGTAGPAAAAGPATLAACQSCAQEHPALSGRERGGGCTPKGCDLSRLPLLLCLRCSPSSQSPRVGVPQRSWDKAATSGEPAWLTGCPRSWLVQLTDMGRPVVCRPRTACTAGGQ